MKAEDVYRWFNPFEEQERLRQEAAFAFEAGQRSVTRELARMGQEGLDRAIKDATSALGARVARDAVFERAKGGMASIAEMKRIEEQVLELFSLAAFPRVAGIVANGHLRVEMVAPSDKHETTLEFVYEVQCPFKICVGVDPLSYALRYGELARVRL